MSDEELVSQICANNPEDFRLIIERYQQKLFLYVYKYVYDEDKSKDIVQESFIKMYTNLRGFDTDKKFSPWAYRITHNETINFIKKNRNNVSIEENNWLPELADENSDLLEEISQKIANEKLHSSIAKLHPKYRSPLVLHYFQGCDYETTAQILNIPRSTVGVRIKRAKSKLKQLLEKEHVNA